MKRVIVVLMSFFLMGFSLQAENLIVTIVIGSVEYKKSDSDKWVKVKPHMILSEEGTIQTKKDGKLKLRFVEGQVEMYIPSDKVIKVSSLVKKKNALMKDSNKLKINLFKAKMSKDEQTKGNGSPVAVAGVRGNKEGKVTNEKSYDLIWDE